MSVLLELVLQSTYAQQSIINRFNYLATGTPDEDNAAAALVQAFGCIWDTSAYPAGLPFADILLLQNVDVVYQFASCRDVYSDLDFIEVPFVNPAVGQDSTSDEATAPYVAYGLRTNRIRTDIRRGTKRFVGVTEDRVTPGGVLAAGSAAIWDDLSALMSDVLEYDDEGNILTFSPCVVKKMEYVPNPDNPTKTAYKYYPTLAAQLPNIAVGVTWEIYNTTRSQVSRQRGRGA